MGWLEMRKARKELEKMGLDKTYLKNIGKELRQGEKGLRSQRDEMRKLESPTYRKLIIEINKIIDNNDTVSKKKWDSKKIVMVANLSDDERDDLYQQIERIYG